MITKFFSSETSKDAVIIRYYERSHKVLFIVNQFDDFSENIKLINIMLEYLKLNDIKWLEMKLEPNFTVPTNTVWFKNKRNGNINCHIEDFEKFYLANIFGIVQSRAIYISTKLDEYESDNNNDDSGEWTTVVDRKRLRKTKIEQIKKEAEGLLEDWNNLE